MCRLDLKRAALVVVIGSVAGLAPSGSDLIAQAPPSGAPRAQQGASRDRAALEQQVQRRLADIARRELKLNEAQFSRLQEVNARFDSERRETIQRERRTRMQLRREMQKGAAADEAAVSRLLDAMLETQRDRLSVLEAEQEALAAFMSPVQRAKYIGLQEGFRRQVEQRRQRMPEQRGERRGPPGSGRS